MARPCSICNHESREEIDKALINDEPLSGIVTQYSGITKTSLFRHKAKHLPQALSQAQQAQEVAQGDRIMAELERCFKRVNLLFDACDEWLRDPEDPSKYSLAPRCGDVRVVYWEPGQERGRPKKAPLSELLGRIEGAGYRVESWESKYADPRELILKTANRLQGQVELLAKLMGELPPEYEPIIASIILVLKREIQDEPTLKRISEQLKLEAGREQGNDMNGGAI